MNFRLRWRIHIVKTQKSTAARCALTFVAAGSALALTACGAGQISQTANQVAAVNGSAAEEGNVAVRDVSVVVTPDNDVAVKFTASNLEDKGSEITLDSVTVGGQDVTLEGDATIQPGCNLVADYAGAIDELKKGGDATCNNYVVTELSNTSDVYVGGNADVEFSFDSGNVSVPASVVAYTPTAGEYHRDGAGLTDQDGAEAGAAH